MSGGGFIGRGAAFASLCLVLASIPARSAEAPTASGGTMAVDDTKLHCLRREDICVTHGFIGTDPAGRLSIEDPVVRAISTRGISPTAELAFTLLGPTSRSVPLKSGQMRRQLGLKLRAQDGCNLVYVMWRLEPKNELLVSIKSNPGMKTNAECGTRGYSNLVPARSKVLPAPQPGQPHRLRAVLGENGASLEVFVDDVSVWAGALGAKAMAFDGPIGIRTDNLRLTAELCQAPHVSPSQRQLPPCTPTKEE